MSVIIKPIITEKMSILEEKLGRYGFIVENSANKVQIRKDVEATYGVTVESVNTMRYAGKAKRNKKLGRWMVEPIHSKRQLLLLKRVRL